MLKTDVENAQELAQLLFDLTQEEGISVEIHHPNMDFDGPNSTIHINNVFDQTSFQYFGESVLDCLKEAKLFHTDESQ